MKTKSFDEPLTKAAADSLKHAAKAAKERARQTKVPLVFWKDGRVVHVPVGRVLNGKPRRRVAS